MNVGLISVVSIVSLARILFASFGCGAVLWGAIEWPHFLKESSLNYIANQIIAGEKFKPSILDRHLSEAETTGNSLDCRPNINRGVAIIRLRLYELAATGNHDDHLNELRRSLEATIIASLFCSPADPFLWLALYSLNNGEDHGKLKELKYLAMSYHLGPREGWIMLKRNPIALNIFEHLPSKLSTDAINEFVGLLNSEFFQEAVEIFSGVTGPPRYAIIPRLKTLPLRLRQAFSKALYNRGLDVPIPGVEPYGLKQ